MPSPTSEETKVRTVTPDKRLDCWKEVASHLGRGERTVKRWEAERGLPIRRVPGAGRATIYAYTAELDEWLKSRGAQELESDGEAVQEIAGTTDMTAVAESPAAATIVARDVSVELDLSTPVAQPLSRGLQRKWTFALAGLALVGIAGAGIRLAALHHRGLFPSSAISAGSAKDDRAAYSTGAAAVSDADKRQAHDLYLKGRFEWNKRTSDSLERALDDFTEAIVHDPTSAPAYSGLSDTYVLMHEYSSTREINTYERAIAASKKAVQLDDSLAEAHRSLAFAEVWGSWNFAEGEKHFRRAIELDPKDPLTHLWFATAFEGLPDWRGVVHREFDRAQELDPSSPVILSNKGIWLFEVGERKAGLEMEHQVERDNPDFIAPHRYLATMYWIVRDYPQFLAESEKAATLKQDAVRMQLTDTARAGFRRDGERGLLENIYLAQKKFDPHNEWVSPSLAEVCLRLGKIDETIQLLQDGVNHHNPPFGISLIPDYEALKDDPRYQRLISQFKVPLPTDQEP